MSGKRYASPFKLKDGWGVRCAWQVVAGQTVEVRSRAGKTWKVIIAGVLWIDDNDGSHVCATRSANKRPTRRW